MKKKLKHHIIHKDDMEEGVVYFGILPDGCYQVKGKMHGIVTAQNISIGAPELVIKATMNAMFVIEKYGIEKMQEIWDGKCTNYPVHPKETHYRIEEII